MKGLMNIVLIVLALNYTSINCNYLVPKSAWDVIHNGKVYDVFHKNLYYQIQHVESKVYAVCYHSDYKEPESDFKYTLDKNLSRDYFRFKSGEELICNTKENNQSRSFEFLKSPSDIFISYDWLERSRIFEYEDDDYLPGKTYHRFWILLSRIPKSERVKDLTTVDKYSYFTVKLHPDYNLKYKIKLNEVKPLEDLLAENKKTDVLQTWDFVNNGPGEIIQWAEHKREMKQSVTFESKHTFMKSTSLSESDMKSVFESLSVHASTEAHIGVPFSYGVTAKLEANAHHQVNRTKQMNKSTGTDVTDSTSERNSFENTNTISIFQEVTCPPYTKIHVTAKITHLDNLFIDYIMILSVEGTGPTFADNGKLNSSYLNVLLNDVGYDMVPDEVNEFELIYNIPLRIKANLGIKTSIVSEEIK